ncbi:hypothetical protein A5320_17850 [Rheinheimera sp. SA_1]|nr:hypothetical protein A5320_17850 [Rheinheimera sp. SA_1]
MAYVLHLERRNFEPAQLIRLANRALANMTNFKRKISFRMSTIISAIYLILCVFLAYQLFYGETTSKVENLIGGAFVTMLAVTIQHLVNIEDQRNNEFLKKHRIINILERRDDKEYYKKIVSNSNNSIDMMFYTGRRFVDDFCHHTEGDNYLVKALTRGVKVRMLLACENNVEDSERGDLNKTIEKLNKTKSIYNELLEIRQYSTKPSHNIFATEQDIIVGPYFNLSGRRYNHSIHLLAQAPYAAGYKMYFEEIWSQSKPC